LTCCCDDDKLLGFITTENLNNNPSTALKISCTREWSWVCWCIRFRATRVGWVCALTFTVLHYVLLTHILLHMWRNMSAETRTTMTFARGWVSHAAYLPRASRIMSECNRVLLKTSQSWWIWSLYFRNVQSGVQTHNRSFQMGIFNHRKCSTFLFLCQSISICFILL